MTKEYYTDYHRSLCERMRNARDHHCPLTAMARLRDMARLENEYSGTPYGECLERLKEQYLSKEGSNGKV